MFQYWLDKQASANITEPDTDTFSSLHDQGYFCKWGFFFLKSLDLHVHCQQPKNSLNVFAISQNT